MFEVSADNSRHLADVNRFVDLINSSDLFSRDADIFVARAPGRLDVMGGIADYSGSVMLEMPIAEATFAAAQRSNDGKIAITSLTKGEDPKIFEMPVTDLEISDYAEIRDRFGRDAATHWASYVAGVFFCLKHEHSVDFENGARLLITSSIPIGKGVSSSAALEVSTMQSAAAAFGIKIEPRELAILCQTVENEIVGAACGVMDQITVNFGVENALLPILCQPAEPRHPIGMPDDIELWGIDSGVRHAVAGSDYTSVRIGAFMGYRMIAAVANLPVQIIGDGLVRVEDNRWGGYLANVSPAEYESQFRESLPASLRGAEFLETYGGTTDRVTTIDPSKSYMVKSPAEFPIYENSRVNVFTELLTEPLDGSHLDHLGSLMFESHADYAACGLTEQGTERLVALAREFKDHGILGARITGGGSGGTVAILARRGSKDPIGRIAAQYRAETGRDPYIFHGSSPGCDAFGTLRLRRLADTPARS